MIEVPEKWQNAADDGDGQFAIAIALLSVSRAIHYLGNGDAATTMGAIENLAKVVGEKFDGLTDAVNGLP